MYPLFICYHLIMSYFLYFLLTFFVFPQTCCNQSESSFSFCAWFCVSSPNLSFYPVMIQDISAYVPLMYISFNFLFHFSLQVMFHIYFILQHCSVVLSIPLEDLCNTCHFSPSCGGKLFYLPVQFI